MLVGLYLFEYSKKVRRSTRCLIVISICSVCLLFSSPVQAQFGGGGGDISRTLPLETVDPLDPLSSGAPAPWGTDPDTVSGLTVSEKVESPGFLQEKVTDSEGNVFFFQRFSTSDFSMASFTKFRGGLTNDPEGNLVFNQEISDPAFGLTEKTVMDGFKQPISIHSDIVERNVATISGGLNQMDMHFRQVPFFDSASRKVLVRQDIGVWMTSFSGVSNNDITQSQNFTLNSGQLSHEIATEASGGGGGGSAGDVNWWNDLEAVKIIDPANNQLLNFSRCNDFGDPTGRFTFFSNQGSRDGCSGSGSGGSPRPTILAHESDSFQLTPINWERWGDNGSDSFSSGLNTNFPDGGGGGGGFGR